MKQMMDDLKSKRIQAKEKIQSRNFSTENLLLIQDYFFEFSERVHLLKVDPKSAEWIEKVIKKQGIKSFCLNLILTMENWYTLNNYCTDGGAYRCSYEMKDYPKVVEKFYSLLSSKDRAAVRNEPACGI
jgi:hypothetical protein